MSTDAQTPPAEAASPNGAAEAPLAHKILLVTDAWEPQVNGVVRVNLRRDLALDTLLPTLPVRARALAAWRLEDQWQKNLRIPV